MSAPQSYFDNFSPETSPYVRGIRTRAGKGLSFSQEHWATISIVVAILVAIIMFSVASKYQKQESKRQQAKNMNIIAGVILAGAVGGAAFKFYKQKG